MKSIIFKINLVFIALTTAPSFASEQITFGNFQSRGLLTLPASPLCNYPLVIMQPGSGDNGPEEMVPSSMTATGQDESIFKGFSEGLNRSNVATLSIGKPGIDFFKSWERKDYFYDINLYSNLEWQDLIDNLNDAVSYGKNLNCVDKNRIYLLGHSEGTQVAIDLARQNPNQTKGLLLIGFSGESLDTTIQWQFFRRAIDVLIEPDIDTNHDGYMSYEEASLWPEISWNWKSKNDKVSYAEIEQTLRQNPYLQNEYVKVKSAKIWKDVFFRPSIYSEAASLSEDLYVFTGEKDIQTRPEEALKMEEECQLRQKNNCEVYIVPRLGHAMSRPKGPRSHALLDATLGPVDEIFKDLLEQVGEKL